MTKKVPPDQPPVVDVHKMLEAEVGRCADGVCSCIAGDIATEGKEASRAPELPVDVSYTEIFRAEDVARLIFGGRRAERGESGFIGIFSQVAPPSIDRRAAITRPHSIVYVSQPERIGDFAKLREPHWSLCSFKTESIAAGRKFDQAFEHSHRWVGRVYATAIHLHPSTKSGCDSREYFLEKVRMLRLPPPCVWVVETDRVGATLRYYALFLEDDPLEAERAKILFDKVQMAFRARMPDVDFLWSNVTSTLPAPGFRTRYFGGGARATLQQLVFWLQRHRDPSDVAFSSDPRFPLTNDQRARLHRAEAEIEKYTKRRATKPRLTKRGTYPWKHSVQKYRNEADEMKKFLRVLTALPPTYSSYDFIRDFAARVKRFEFHRDHARDAKHAFREAFREATEVNDMLHPSKRLTPQLLKRAVMRGDPTKFINSRDEVGAKLGITARIAASVGFKALAPLAVRVERRIAELTEEAKRKKEKSIANPTKKVDDSVAERKEDREARDHEIEERLKHGFPTSWIVNELSVHPETVRRARKRLVAAGVAVNQKREKPGRKKEDSDTLKDG